MPGLLGLGLLIFLLLLMVFSISFLSFAGSIAQKNNYVNNPDIKYQLLSKKLVIKSL